MSQVAISGNASGTGTLTIAAPNTNSNYTLTLPALTGTVLTSATAGTVLQVVRATYNTTTSTTSTSFVTSNLSASITPISSTNKVLVFLLSTVATANGSTSIPVTLYRNATNVAGGTTPITDLVTSGNNWAMNFNYLDSPATTSATTYTFYFRSGNGSLVYTNIAGYTSSLILMEIAA